MVCPSQRIEYHQWLPLTRGVNRAAQIIERTVQRIGPKFQDFAPQAFLRFRLRNRSIPVRRTYPNVESGPYSFTKSFEPICSFE